MGAPSPQPTAPPARRTRTRMLRTCAARPPAMAKGSFMAASKGATSTARTALPGRVTLGEVFGQALVGEGESVDRRALRVRYEGELVHVVVGVLGQPEEPGLAGGHEAAAVLVELHVLAGVALVQPHVVLLHEEDPGLRR